MENKARFNLNKALQDWKAELATQPGIGAENIRELETHLLESIAAFKKRGCSDYAAFSLAKQKLGSAQQLGTEFAKENLLKVWRDRVFWITTVTLFLQLVAMGTIPLFERLAHPVSAALGLSQSWVVLAFLEVIPLLLVAIVMATGFAQIIFRRLHWIFSDRWRFAATGVIAILGTIITATNSPVLWHALPAQVIFEVGFLGFAVFIWPRELAIVMVGTGARLRSSITLWRDRLFWAVLALLAIRVWTFVPTIAAVELMRIKGMAALRNPWWAVTDLSVWLLPMAVVGLVLASARLSVLAQWLHTRSRVGFITCALSLIWLAQALWISRRAPAPDYLSTVDWSLEIQRELLSGVILSAGLIAITLWAMPSRAGQRQEDEDRFRYA